MQEVVFVAVLLGTSEVVCGMEEEAAAALAGVMRYQTYGDAEGEGD